MGRCGRLRVREQFSFDRMVATYTKMVEEAINQRSAPEMQIEDGVGIGGRPVILLDLDNTIVDWDSEFQARWRKRNAGHANQHPEIITNRSHFEVESNFPEEYRQDVLDVIGEPGFYRNLETFPGALEAVKEMEQAGCVVRFCTSTHPVCHSQCALEKMDWITENFGADYVSKVIITSDKTTVKGDILIDDKPKIVGCVEEPDWIHVLYDQPYNQNVKNAPRLDSWHDWRKVVEPLLSKGGSDSK